MRGSWRIGELAGIGVFVHWSFVIVPVLVFMSALSAGAGTAAAVASLAFVLSIFGCVVLHEVGHALAARRYGIATRDITLLPIGGVARLERMPDKPGQELVVALAGPAVNVLIAGLLLLALMALGSAGQLFSISLAGGSFLAKLMWANVALVVFNMLPAFPMDGGRVLRALLAMRLPYDRATDIAAGVGQVMAVIFAVVGVMWNWMLVFVAVFVFLAARGESQMARWRARARSIPVRDVMQPTFHMLRGDVRLHEIVRELLFRGQPAFPVVDGNHFVGMLYTSDVLRAVSNGQDFRQVGELTDRHVPIVDANQSLEAVLDQLRDNQHPCVPVTRAGQLVGLLSMNELAMRSGTMPIAAN